MYIPGARGHESGDHSSSVSAIAQKQTRNKSWFLVRLRTQKLWVVTEDSSEYVSCDDKNLLGLLATVLPRISTMDDAAAQRVELFDGLLNARPFRFTASEDAGDTQ